MGEGPEFDAINGVKKYNSGGLAEVALGLVGQSPFMMGMATITKSSGHDAEFMGESPALDVVRSI